MECKGVEGMETVDLERCHDSYTFYEAASVVGRKSSSTLDQIVVSIAVVSDMVC